MSVSERGIVPDVLMSSADEWTDDDSGFNKAVDVMPRQR